MVHQQAPHQFSVAGVLLGARREMIREVVMCVCAFALGLESAGGAADHQDVMVVRIGVLNALLGRQQS